MCELHMRRTNRIVPTYTGDVSGACSALFELGGMVVIHDPSGCNSTYNTHDETRWYDHDSLIFITGLVERDAILHGTPRDRAVHGTRVETREPQPRGNLLRDARLTRPTGAIYGNNHTFSSRHQRKEAGSSRTSAKENLAPILS